MKKIIILLISILSPLSFIHADSIEKFHVDIKLNIDNSAIITETIQYNFDSEFRHGIYREIPYNFKPKGNYFSIDLKPISVTDEFGNEYNYTNDGYGGLNLKIGDPNKYADLLETYIIKYEADNIVGFFEENDEFYWNLTGNEWDVDYIKNVSATIKFPESIKERIDNYEYCGLVGDKNICGSFLVSGDTVDYKMNNDLILNAGEGVTIDLEFDKGIIVGKGLLYNIWGIIYNYIYIPISIFLAIFFFRKFFSLNHKISKLYKKFKKNNPEQVQYDPGEFSLIEASFFHDGKTSNDKDLSAFIVWAAIKRYIKIIEDDGDYTFEKLEKFSELPDGAEKEFIEEITKIKLVNKFGSSKSVYKNEENGVFSNIFISLTMKELSNSLYNVYAQKIIDNGYIDEQKIEKIDSEISKHIQSGSKSKVNYFGYISNKKIIFIVVFLFLAINPGIFFMILVPLFFPFLPWNFGFIFSLIMVIMALLFILFISGVPAYTEKGFRASWYINGLYKYINMSEKERMEFANAPEKTPVLFEKLLPYAMVFGLEKKWSKEFKGIYGDNLDWYSSTSGKAFSVGSIGSLSGALSSSITPPSSSSSGGSSSGGGSSGGGGGGGGGGSW